MVQTSTPALAQPTGGALSASPDFAVAGHYGSWTVTYVEQHAPIEAGGGLRIQLPDTWHAGERNSATPLQADDPQADHFVKAYTSSATASVRAVVEGQSDEYLVKGRRRSLDCREERYVFVVRVEVSDGSILPGDTLRVVYGDRSGGSRGLIAGEIASPPEPVLAALDRDGSGEWSLLEPGPEVHVKSGAPAAVLASGPSSLVVGEEAHIRLAVVDRNFNPVDDFEGELAVRLVTGEARWSLPDRLVLDKGWGQLAFVPTAPGVLRLEVSLRDRLLETTTNPMRVFAEEPGERIFWGDLHSHGTHSHDGVGLEPFSYARNVAGLDFYALTDHSMAPGDEGCPAGLGPHVWEAYTAQTEAHHEPGRFVTLHAYEASFGAPYGHHNVFFRDQPGALIVPTRSEREAARSPEERTAATLPELWSMLEAGEALTIPHHTGKMPTPVLWTPQDPELRRNIEVYSAHGLSEVYDPEHPLAFEQSDFTGPSRSATGPQFVQDAWMAGLELSVIGSSDDHRAQPGKPHFGLAAVFAPELSREAVFEALYDRATYATTGARILLSFTVGGRPMGSRATTGENDPVLRIEAHGTETIDLVEVLRYSEGDGAFKVIHAIRPESPDFEWAHTDPGFRDEAIYYVRLRQRPTVFGRVAMAWSSPVWVSRGEREE